MSQFPLISGNATTTAGFGLDLATDAADTSFDTYIFEENGVQTAYMVFVIKNTNTTPGSSLIISDIVGNEDFLEHFTLSPLDASDNINLGLTDDNKIKAAIANCNVTGLTAATDASGASGFIGYPQTGGITDSDDLDGLDFSTNAHASELNTSPSKYCIPIYSHLDIIGVDNAIPMNSYAAFIIKFQPTINIAASDGYSPELTIYNNASTQTISFNAIVTNTLSYFAKIGTASDGGGSDDEWTTASGELLDGNEFALGLYPRGFSYADTGKTLKFSDNSTTSGFWRYSFSSGQLPTNLHTTTDLVQDGITLAPYGNSNVLNKFKSSWQHPNSVFTDVDNCADNVQSGIINTIVSEVDENVELYKNYSLSSTSTIQDQQSNMDFSTTSVSSRWNINKHTTADAVTLKIPTYIGKVLNWTYPVQTEDGSSDQYFVWSVTSGYYNLISMHTSQIDIHKKSDVSYSDGTNLDQYINTQTAPSGINGPYLRSTTGTVNGMTRGDVLDISVYFRFNYFGDTNASSVLYLVNDGNDFNLSSNYCSLYSDYGGSQNNSSGDVDASKYGTGVDFGVSSLTTSTSDVSFSGFSSYTHNGALLGLLYPTHVNGFLPAHLYVDGTYNSTISFREGFWGIIDAYYSPGNVGNKTLWDYLGKGGTVNDTHGPRYRFGFRPIQSRLELISTESVQDSLNVDVDPKIKLFWDTASDVEDATEYSRKTQELEALTWYKHNSTTAYATGTPFDAAMTDANTVSIEGTWYGSAGVSIVRPHCWNNGNSGSPVRDVEIGYTDYGAYFKHAPTNRTIRTSGNTEAKEYEEGTLKYFKLEDATYNSDIQKYRSVGRLYFKNTGDYPIYIHKVEVGTHGFTPDNGNVYASSRDNMLVPVSNTNYKPVVTGTPATESNDPTWGVDGSKSTSWYVVSGAGVGANASTEKVFPDDLGGTPSSARTYYYDSYSNASYVGNKRVFIPTNNIEGTSWDNSIIEDNGSSIDKNCIDITFDLDPKNDSALDNGDYYTQIVVSYYVDDYKNRKNPIESEGITSHQSLEIGNNDNIQSRLHISKYLVKCNISATADIFIVDSENDAIESNTITLPTLTIN